MLINIHWNIYYWPKKPCSGMSFSFYTTHDHRVPKSHQGRALSGRYWPCHTHSYTTKVPGTLASPTWTLTPLQAPGERPSGLIPSLKNRSKYARGWSRWKTEGSICDVDWLEDAILTQKLWKNTLCKPFFGYWEDLDPGTRIHSQESI